MNGFPINRRGPQRGAAAAAILGAGLSVSAHAATTIAASAYSQYEYNTNVYALAPGQPVPGTTGTSRGDGFLAYGATLAATDTLDLQKLYLNLGATDFHYDRLTQLDHSEYSLDGGWKWQLGQALTGTLDVARTRSMVAFSQVIDSNLVVQTEQRETGSAGYQFLPDWRVEGSAYTRTVDSPEPPEAPDLKLVETSGQTALKFTGLAHLTAGVTASYLAGSFDREGALAPGSEPSYRQSSEAFTVQYKASGLSTFNGVLGYTRRSSESELNNVSGFTGDLSYQRYLTGKTSVTADVSRAVNSFVTGAGSEIDTAATLSLNYQATFKTGVHFNYVYTNRDLPDQGYIPGTSRVDHDQYVNVLLDWEALEWVSLKPYARYQVRSSNFLDGGYSSMTYGVIFTLQWQKR